MSAALDTRAEIIKLARLLGLDPEQLGYLEFAPADDIRQLRDQVTDVLFDRDAARLGRLAAAAKLIPAPLAATIAQRALGPVLCARLASLADPGKAVDTAKRLPSPFLADVAVEVDPRRAKDVIARVPAKLVAEVATELDRRGELVTMGRFVGYVGDDAIVAAIAGVGDKSLLHIAFTMEGKERLDHMLSLLPPDRLPGVITAAEQDGLWPEALDLLSHVSPERRGALGDLVAEEPGALDSLARAADEQNLWDAVLPIVPTMSDGGRKKIAAMAASLDQPMLERVIDAVATQDMWALFVPLAAEDMDDAGRNRVAQVVAGVDQSVIRGLADAVERDGLWEQLLEIASGMTGEQLDRIADRLLGEGLEDRLPSLIAAIEQGGLWETGLRLLAGLEPELKAKLVAPASTLGPEARASVLEHARELDMVEQLGPIADALVASA